MFHLEWLLPVAFAIWILITMIRKTEEERRSRERNSPNPDKPPAPARPRQAAGDIDRFLDEVNRRRSQPAERKPRAASEQRPRTVVAVPVREALSPPRRRAAVPTSPAVLPPAPAPAASLPVRAPVRAFDAIMAIRADQPAPPTQNPKGPEPAPPVAKQEPPPPPARPAQLLVQMLRTPGSLQAAYLLQEVLSPPLSRRPRRRPPFASGQSHE